MYTNSRIMAVPCDKYKTSFEFDPRVAERAAGMISDADAMVNRDDIVEATVVLNDCSGYRSPPKKKQQPRTSSMFERMLPSMLA